MKLGAIIEWLGDISEFRGLVRLADNLGYDIIGVGTRRAVLTSCTCRSPSRRKKARTQF